jgi:Ni/Fe-hydrogenase subunit HybB-like protein
MLYESPLLPAAFVAAAMASGTALMIITIVTLFKITNRHVDDALIIWLGRFLAIILLVVLYFLFMENAYRVYVVELRDAAIYYLFGGWHALLFWVGLILIGCCIPMFLLFRNKTGKSVRWILIASIMVVLGILCERYVIVLPGLMHPPEMFPGMLVTGSGVPEGYVAYSMGFVEILQALGVFGAVGFLFVWGLKVFKLLPNEAKAIV